MNRITHSGSPEAGVRWFVPTRHKKLFRCFPCLRVFQGVPERLLVSRGSKVGATYLSRHCLTLKGNMPTLVSTNERQTAQSAVNGLSFGNEVARPEVSARNLAGCRSASRK
jgi:hypothetical protein